MPGRAAIHEAVSREMKDPAFRRMAMEAVAVLDGNPSLFGTFPDFEQFEIPFLDIYCQAASDRFVQFEDLVLAALAWQAIQHGELAYCFMQTPDEPHSDADAVGNNAILSRLVDDYTTPPLHLLEASFRGGRGPGEDGYLRFAEPPIRAFEGYGTDSRGVPEEPPSAPVDGSRKLFPLEVGYCLPDQMEMHLSQSRCVARFPYGQRFVILLERLIPHRRWAV